MADAGYQGSGVQPIGSNVPADGSQTPPNANDQQAALQAMANQAALLRQEAAKAQKTEVKDHVAQVGSTQAMADADLLDAHVKQQSQALLGQLTSADTMSADGRPVGAKLLGQLPGVGTQGVAPAAAPAAAPATDATVDPRTTQSPETLANNEIIRKHAAEIVTGQKSMFGKVLQTMFPGIVQQYETNTLANLKTALEIGGGDPQSDYYKAFSGTLKKAAVELTPEQLANMNMQQLKATTDALTAVQSNQAATLTAQVKQYQNYLEGRSMKAKAFGDKNDDLNSISDDISTTLTSIRRTNASAKNIKGLKIGPQGVVESDKPLIPQGEDMSTSAGAKNSGTIGGYTFKKPTAK